jgi:glycosyltransferase involved in cell wall biosynthesis
LPAVGEGLALAALEAAASGCALLLTEGCNMPEAAAHGAALIAERNVGALSRALQQLLESPNLRHSMGAAAQRWAENTFRWKKVAEQVAQLYAECITLKGQ